MPSSNGQSDCSIGGYNNSKYKYEIIVPLVTVININYCI